MQIILRLFAESQGNCTQELVDIVRNSTLSYLENDPNIKAVQQVIVTCFNANGDVGAIAANRTIAHLQRVSGLCRVCIGWEEAGQLSLCLVISCSVYTLQVSQHHSRALQDFGEIPKGSPPPHSTAL